MSIRLALRSFRRAPAFTAAAVLTLAIGLGATSTIFALVDAVLLRGLPYRAAEELVLVRGEQRREGAAAEFPIGWLDVQSLAEDRSAFSEIVPLSGARSFNLSANGEIEHISGEMIGDGLFRVLGVSMALGRPFDRTETEPPGQRVVILSHDLWTRRFGGDRGVIGRSIMLNDAPYTVVGVAAPRFTGISDAAKVWIPLGLAGQLYGEHYISLRQFRWLSAVARVRPGVSAAAAARALAVSSARIERAFPKENEKFGYVATPLFDAFFGAQQRPLWSLMAAAAFVLLIACTNVANLLLARATARRHETAVRLALGASRRQLAALGLGESMTLMAFGTAAGMAIAGWGARVVVASGALAVPTFQDVGVNPFVFAVTVAVAALCAAVFGLIPALLAARVAPREGITDGGKGASGGRGRIGFQRGLIVAEVAIAVALLAGAGLMRKGFARFAGTDLGFTRDGVLTLRVDLTADRYKQNEAAIGLVRRLVDETSTIPGVTAVATEGPGYPTSGWYQIELLRGDGSTNTDALPARRHHVTPGYFATLGVRLLAGRDFTGSDVAGAPRVIVVSEAYAKRAWPGESPIGKHLKTIGPTPAELAVVGVVADVGHGGLQTSTEAQTDVYISALQSPARSPALVTLFVRHRGDFAPLLEPLRSAMSRIDPTLPFYDIRTLQGRLEDQTATGRFLVRLMSLFAVVGLVLAAIGVYGVVSYGVAQRTREIGIRIALGATQPRVVWHVVQSALIPVLAGVGLGLVAVWGLHRFVTSLLYGVGALDPPTLGVTVVALVAVALVASWLPARRATRIEPVSALRDS